MKKLILFSVSMLLLSACVSKQEYAALEAKHKETQDLLNSATVKLNACLEDKATAAARATALEEQINDLRKTNDNLIQSNKDLTMLTSQGASNVEKTLESLKEKDLTRIFQPFEQVESSASRRFQGTGLGLSLTKKIVKLHGGRIWVDSEGENKGSTFSFILPVSPSNILFDSE